MVRVAQNEKEGGGGIEGHLLDRKGKKDASCGGHKHVGGTKRGNASLGFVKDHTYLGTVFWGAAGKKRGQWERGDPGRKSTNWGVGRKTTRTLA